MFDSDYNPAIRWRILALSCLVLFGQYFCYDIPAVVHDHLSKYSGVSEQDFPWYFNSLYSAYSLPNLVLPLAFGYVVDKSSGSRIIQILAVSTCIGQLLVTLGITYQFPWMAILGRFTFGIGSESMGVAQNAILAHFFEGKEVAFALALNVSFARFGTIFNDWFSPYLSETVGIPATFSFGFLCVFLSLVCAVELARTMDTSSSIGVPSMSHGNHARETFWQSTRSLSVSFWMVSLACVLGYCSILPFASVFVAIKPSGLTQKTASQVVSIPFLLCAVLTPFIGRFVDRFGKAAWVATSSSFLLCLSHAMFSSYHHVVVMIILGLAYAGFVASVWPLVPLAVRDDHVGLGYGIMTALQNTGLTIVPLVIALIKHETGSYDNTRWLFIGLSLGTLLASMWLANELPGLSSLKVTDKAATDLETEPLAAQVESQYS